MKQNDIAIIIVVAFISAIVSFFASNKIFVTPSNRQQKAEVVDVITSTFEKPNTAYFNSNSINPTQQSILSGDSNQNPFNGSGN